MKVIVVYLVPRKYRMFWSTFLQIVPNDEFVENISPKLSFSLEIVVWTLEFYEIF